jgi:heme exporter protein D
MGIFSPKPIAQLLVEETIRHKANKKEVSQKEAKEQAIKDAKRHEENKRQGML